VAGMKAPAVANRSGWAQGERQSSTPTASAIAAYSSRLRAL
jgi:hypothetical protein